MKCKQLIDILSALPEDAELVIGNLKLPANEDYRKLVRVEPKTVEIEAARIVRVHKPDQFTSTVYVLTPSN